MVSKTVFVRFDNISKQNWISLRFIIQDMLELWKCRICTQIRTFDLGSDAAKDFDQNFCEYLQVLNIFVYLYIVILVLVVVSTSQVVFLL